MCGISGKIGVWIHNFLSNRQQYISVNGTTLSEAEVKSGIPQGSVLWPLLFPIHVSDINYQIAGSVRSEAMLLGFQYSVVFRGI